MKKVCYLLLLIIMLSTTCIATGCKKKNNGGLMDDSSERINVKELSNKFFIDIFEITNDELYILGSIKTRNADENIEVKDE